ncbi:MAG: hypothetical protein HDS60_03635 [Barnesiella sp.]|nr:hypothetical protein [Barnesiella sp.]
MAFDPFNDHYFFSGSSYRDYCYVRKDIEDVDFEDITQEQPKHQIDEKARNAQITKEVNTRFADLFERNPMAAGIVSCLFILGADWADQHPVSEFSSVAAWSAAIMQEADNLMKDLPEEKELNPLFRMAMSSVFYLGANWAKEHPAPML